MNSTLIRIVIFTSLLVSCAPKYEFYCPTNNEDALDHFNNGLRLFKSGYVDHATKLFIDSIDEDSMFCDAYDNLALIARLDEDFETAIILLKKSLEINPDNNFALQNSGFYYYILGMNDEAINSFKKLAVLQPKNEEAYYGLGSSYLELGNLKEAFNNTEIAFGLYDEKNLIIKPNMNTLMGRIYYEMKNYEEAIEYLERAQPLLKINPFADLYLGLCYYYMNPSDKEEAKSLLKSVPELREKIPQEVIEDLDL